MRQLSFLLLFLFPLFTKGQEEPGQPDQPKKELQALRITSQISIDGKLDETDWQAAPIAGDFTQYDPVNGAPSNYRSEVRVLYDDQAIYIGGMFYDPSPDSILTQLSRRDAGEVNADFMGVYFDTYLDQQNAFGFEVSAAGVQTDMRMFSNGDDYAWDAVWMSNVQLTPEGWVAELKIPYSALRFPKADSQKWGFNIERLVRRNREKSHWDPSFKAQQGFVNQFGILTGLENIEAPIRLSLTPYVSAYARHYPYNEKGRSNIDQSLSGGMDVKYGLNDAFTLDMTLVPDFSQVQSDRQVLNLSPYEVQFNENRPFFTEGTELFSKGGVFYSRRVGGTPIGYYALERKLNQGDVVLENPNTARLLNATKITGRTKKKLGIGLFNGVTRNTFALVADSLGNERKILTDPATNYNVFVLDQALKNNSYVTLSNTNVTRSHGYYNANVTGLQFRMADKSNTYAVRMGGNLSQLYFKGHPDEGSAKDQFGHQYNMTVSKISGTWQYSATRWVESHTYDPNDLGYLASNNSISHSVNVSYNRFQPFWKLLNLTTSMGVSHQQLESPRTFTGFNFYGNTHFRTRGFLSAGAYFGFQPIESFDYFEARTLGQPFVRQPNGEGNVWISTDYRKRFALDVNAGLYRSNKFKQRSYFGGISPRFRFSDKLSVISSFNYNVNFRDIGFAGYEQTSNVARFGARNRHTSELTLTGAYIFTARMALNLNLRHYWSGAAYQEFYSVTPTGYLLSDTSFHRGNDNFNAFNIDLVYTWRFAPGSEINLVYKDAVLTHQKDFIPTYFDNITNTFNTPATNSLSFKVIYYLDYLTLKRAIRT